MKINEFTIYNNCFPAGDAEIDSRNATYDYIEQNSNMGLTQNDQFSQNLIFFVFNILFRKVSDRFDRVFWFGDFNYRVELSSENLKESIKDRNYMVFEL